MEGIHRRKLALIEALVLGLATALLAGPARAQGVIGINQAAALAGGVTPGDAPGFPVTISQSGSYVLTGNLTVPDANTDGIQIVDTPSAHVDLGGFEIAGPVSCAYTLPGGFMGPVTCTPTGGTGRGVFSTRTTSGPQEYVATVRNGTIRGMGGSCVELSGQARVEHLQLLNCGGFAIYATGSIANNAIKYAASVGIYGGGDVFGNVITYTHEGIFLRYGGAARGNVVSWSATHGIRCETGCTVVENTVTFSASYGLYLANCAPGGCIPRLVSGYANNLLNHNNRGNSNPQVFGGVETGGNVCG
ncbi:MAG: hypothetical protein OEW06_07925, partial [Gemmatimonadota bacterium]|nr:hypothetical protein [Gemmatimonadota bacterium]